MKKSIKKSLALILALVFALSAFSCVAFADESSAELKNFAVKAASSEKNDEIGIVNWWYCAQDGKYYMFMPSFADLESVKIFFDSDVDIYCNSVKLENGAETSVFANGGEFNLIAANKNYTVVFLTMSELPSIFLNTESGSLDAIHADKSHKESGLLLAVNENGEAEYDNLLESIKGRGNSTWGFPKKPYNIKLEKKENLFGLGKAKNWCLIANHVDKSLIRNQIVYDTARAAGMADSPDCISIDLYINGDYCGVYLLTEKIEIKENRIEITDLEGETEELNEKDLEEYSAGGYTDRFSSYIEGTQRWVNIPNNPENITGGYLLELELADRYPDEASGFVSNSGQTVVVKTPEYASKEQVKYISGYWQEMEDALFAQDGKNSLGKHYTEYIDIESFAMAYLVQEWTCNWDAGLTSNYFYKDIDGKIIAGPVWDFDTSINNSERNRADFRPSDPTCWHARSRNLFYNALLGSETVKQTPNIYALGHKHSDYIEEVRNQWDNGFYAAADEMIESGIDAYAAKTSGAAVMNAVRWNTYSTTDIAVIEANYQKEITKIKDYISARTEFLDANLGMENEPLAITPVSVQRYTGSAVEPSLTVTCVDLTLKEGVDYTVVYENNTETGTATATVIGIGKYEGRQSTVEFEINRLGITFNAGSNDFFNKLGAMFVDIFEILCYWLTKPIFLITK